MTQIQPTARLLDVTRLASRAGRVQTGIDRVERAYLNRFLKDAVPVFGLCQTSYGYLLVPRAGLSAFADALQTQRWGKPDFLSRLSRRLPPSVQAAHTLLRRHAIKRARHRRLGPLLRELGGGAYYNVGHSNLSKDLLSAVTEAGLRSSVMIHDTIPLDFPHFQRPGMSEGFAVKLDAVASGADRILTVSETSAGDILRHFPQIRSIVAAHPGYIPVPLADLPYRKPYVLCLGTIEPRKNHGLLLDIWANGKPAGLDLVICGPRGWKNEEVFKRLDAGIDGVTELNQQTDEQVATLIARAEALVMPSVAEGFGLPLIEAMAQNTPVLCGDLAICHEVLGDYGVYLDTSDPYQWVNSIMALTKADKTAPSFEPAIPTWDTHFKTVLSDTW